MSDERFVPVAPAWWVANCGGVLLTGAVAARTGRPALRLLFAGAVVTHVVEAAVAYHWARREGWSRSAPRWAAQTLGVGFPSLLALRAAAGQ